MVADPAAGKAATVVIGGNGSGGAVIAGRYGLGRTVSWSGAGEARGGESSSNTIWSADVRQLLVNIVRYARRT